MPLDLHCFPKLYEDAFEDIHRSFLEESFSPAKQHGELHLMPLTEESLGAVHLDKPIIGVGFRTHPDFLEGNGVALLALFLPLLALVQVLSVVDDPTDRRRLIGRHLDQVEARLPRQGKSFMRRENAELFLVLVNDPDRSYPDPLVKTKCFGDGWLPFKKN